MNKSIRVSDLNALNQRGNNPMKKQLAAYNDVYYAHHASPKSVETAMKTLFDAFNEEWNALQKAMKKSCETRNDLLFYAYEALHLYYVKRMKGMIHTSHGDKDVN